MSNIFLCGIVHSSHTTCSEMYNHLHEKIHANHGDHQSLTYARIAPAFLVDLERIRKD